MRVELDKDAISSIGCNIASGIIVETFSLKQLKDVTYYVNVRTLYRNYIHCIDGKTVDKIKMFKNKTYYRKLLEGFLDDTFKFVNGCHELGIDVTIYIPDYSDIMKKWNNFRDVKSIKGLKYFILDTEKEASNIILKEMSGVTKETKSVVPYSKNLYITTHIGLDLLSLVDYDDVSLVESNTAEFKKKDLWHTKYHRIGTKSLALFPFNRLIYYILGDNVYVLPQNIKFRQLLYKYAIDLRWFFNTSSLQVIAGIKRKDPMLSMQVENIKKSIGI